MIKAPKRGSFLIKLIVTDSFRLSLSMPVYYKGDKENIHEFKIGEWSIYKCIRVWEALEVKFYSMTKNFY